MAFLVRRSSALLLCLCILPGLACGSSDAAETPSASTGATSMAIGPEGGELVAPDDSGFAGFAIKIPPGALTQTVTVSFAAASDETPLPETAERVGPQILIEPAGTPLAKPAELTLPIDPTMLGNYEGKPDTCKVWVRSGEGWSKVEALAHTEFSVTVPVSAFGVAAAGVNFVPPTRKTCAGCVPIPTGPTQAACDALDGTVEYCIQSLPQPEITLGLDEFASLVVEDRKVYWVAIIGGKPTVLRYDLDDPGPVFQYPAFNGSATGAIGTRGRVAVDGGAVWAGVGGFGNLRFGVGNDAEAFDVGAGKLPCGVAAVPGAPRFYTVSSGTDTFDVRTVNGREDKFHHKVPKTRVADGARTALPPEFVIGSAAGGRTADRYTIESRHRGLGLSFRPDGLTLGSGFWGITFASAPSQGHQVPQAVGIGHRAMGELVHAEAGGALLDRLDVAADGQMTRRPLSARVVLPAGIRDLAFRSANELFVASSGRLELYVVSDAGGIKTVGLPDDGELSPWRIVHVNRAGDSRERDILLVSRGPLVKKGRFSLIRRRTQ